MRNNKGQFIKGNSGYWLGKTRPEETKKKISFTSKGFKLWRNTSGLIKDGSNSYFKKGFKIRLGIKHNEETKEKIREKMKMLNRNKDYYSKVGLKGLLSQQNSKEPTSIEKTLYDYLLLKGILFEKQKVINGRFIVDAFIPSLNLVIEADGKYWHSLKKVQGKDKAENAYLTKCGFNLLRLSEQAINDGSFKEGLVD